MLQACFEAALVTIGPKIPAAGTGCVTTWPLNETQQEFLRAVRVACKDAGKGMRGRLSLVDGLQKCGYWICHSSLSTSLVAQLSSHVVSESNASSAKIVPEVSDSALAAAVCFYGERYLFGLAALDGEIRRRPWLPGHEANDRSANGLQRHVLRVMRGCAGKIITSQQLQNLGRPFRASETGGAAGAAAAVEAIQRVIENMELHGLGVGTERVAGDIFCETSMDGSSTRPPWVFETFWHSLWTFCRHRRRFVRDAAASKRWAGRGMRGGRCC